MKNSNFIILLFCAVLIGILTTSTPFAILQGILAGLAIGIFGLNHPFMILSIVFLIETIVLFALIKAYTRIHT